MALLYIDLLLIRLSIDLSSSFDHIAIIECRKSSTNSLVPFLAMYMMVLFEISPPKIADYNQVDSIFENKMYLNYIARDCIVRKIVFLFCFSYLKGKQYN